MKYKPTKLFKTNCSENEVECLGRFFPNDLERRQHFSNELREYLKKPEFRAAPGFPSGSDDAIVAISDPPYFTACPNPWALDFVSSWQGSKDSGNINPYHREPFAADVSEGKNDPVYGALAYHTKVPYKAVMRYILHYTNPGDVVLDGFCGTGMTGVAAQMCGNIEIVKSLGYRVDGDGEILTETVGGEGSKQWAGFSKIGARRTVLCDLSPAAAYISSAFNTEVDMDSFESEAGMLLEAAEEECGWMFKTPHTAISQETEKQLKKLVEELEKCNSPKEVKQFTAGNDSSLGTINYTLMSDVFVCPECSKEVVFWEVCLDQDAGKVLDSFPCPHCIANLNKRNMERSWETFYDRIINEVVKQAKQVPVLINYTFGGKRFEKKPDIYDLKLFDKILNFEIPYWFPNSKLPNGFNTKQPLVSHGISHVHHFFSKRNLWVVSAIFDKAKSDYGSCLPVVFNMFTRVNKQSSLHVSNFFKKGGGVCKGHLTGTLYIPSISPEIPATKALKDRITTYTRGKKTPGVAYGNTCMSTQSFTSTKLQNDSVDYIFVDPPFGANLNYSELNWNDESWIGVTTNTQEEAIENTTQQKNLNEYRHLMVACLREAYRVLKPGRWMTVEFSNTKAAVWNSIQTALLEAGFIIANVSALDKKIGSFKAVNTPTAVKQDLVISAYKPNNGFEGRFEQEAATEEGVWDFIRTHLGYLPVVKQQGVHLQFIPDRDPRILFDQMVAYYVRKGFLVPISSQEFQIGLSQRFSERDGMYFLPDQVAEYDRKKIVSGNTMQMSLFVTDEASAIQWLRQLIKEKPQTFSDINPQFMQHLGGWSKNEAQLDLRELLNQNFLCYDGKGPVPSQIHSYLSTNHKMRNLSKDDPALVAKARDRWYVPDPNKPNDLEKVREKALLKEFEGYKVVKKKLKVFRLEAVRAGFKKAWQERDYNTIITVAEKIPDMILEEDPKLLMWYDQAVTRIGDGTGEPL